MNTSKCILDVFFPPKTTHYDNPNSPKSQNWPVHEKHVFACSVLSLHIKRSHSKGCGRGQEVSTWWWRWERGQQPDVASVSDTVFGARWSSPRPDPLGQTVCDCERDNKNMCVSFRRLNAFKLSLHTQKPLSLSHNHIQTKTDTQRGSQQRVRHPQHTWMSTHREMNR